MAKKTSENDPAKILSVLRHYTLKDGFQFVIDLEKSEGCYIYDATHKRKILDLFSFFATNALGHNHPRMLSDKQFLKDLRIAGIENPSNSDFYTKQYATFLKTFDKYAMPKEFLHAFFISGGTLAVENALKVAMDWKIQKNFKKGMKAEKGKQVIHFKQAFHGRSGYTYTMSLTNSKPVQTDLFAKFDWPRIDNPKIAFPLTKASTEDVIKREKEAVKQIMKAFKDHRDDICAIIVEPIQSEGGDNHFRKEFLQELRKIADKEEAMLIFDEVQNGVGLSGKFWAYEHFGVIPDLLCFGKKMQVCGVMSTKRVDEVKDNCFTTPGRLNSTWGGNLADMVRATKIMEIIAKDKLVKNSAKQGAYILKQLEKLALNRKITNIRGRGLQCAFDLPTTKDRDGLIKKALENNLLLIGAGEKSIRLRPSLIIEKYHIDEAMGIIDKTMKAMKL
jgi:L-lysine 6-transaminase